MTNLPLAAWVRAVAIAAMATSLMLAALIIGAEEIPALKNWLKATFSHHWLGKGALALMAFAVLSALLRLKSPLYSLSALIKAEAIIIVLAVASIAGFFLLHVLTLV